MKKKFLETLTEKPDDMTGVTEVDGKFYREVEIDDASELKTTLQKERDARSALAKKLESLGDVDLEEYKKLMAAKQEGMTEVEKLESALKKMRTEIDTMKANHDKELADRDGKLRKFHLDEKSRAAALKAGVLPDHVDDVLVLTERRRSLNDAGEIVILDNDGDPTGVGLDDFFGKELKESKPVFYAGIPGGGGAHGGHGKPNARLADIMKLPPAQRLEAAWEAEQS